VPAGQDLPGDLAREPSHLVGDLHGLDEIHREGLLPAARHRLSRLGDEIPRRAAPSQLRQRRTDRAAEPRDEQVGVRRGELGDRADPQVREAAVRVPIPQSAEVGRSPIPAARSRP